jgi:hypothetical protein
MKIIICLIHMIRLILEVNQTIILILINLNTAMNHMKIEQIKLDCKIVKKKYNRA